MAAKVCWYRDAWWVRTRWTAGGKAKKKDRRIGTTKAAKRDAEAIARQVNAALLVGTFEADTARETAIPLGPHLREWHRRYSVTFKPRYQETSLGLIETHLVPFFGEMDLKAVREQDLLDYIGVKLDAGLAPATILNGLSIIRRVFNLAVRDELVLRNPAARLGELMRRVDRSMAPEVRVVTAWTREEAETLLRLAAEHEPRFAPLLRFLLSTGARRGEALGLRWEDVDFDLCRITIRRALTKGVSVTPKSGRARTLAMPPTLAESLFDLLANRRREALHRGWSEVPGWVFCSEAGTALDERNVTRSWDRLRRRAQKRGVRPLKLHTARHTFASLALAAGRSIRWVAEQLGHSNPELTLRVYAHAMPVDEQDLAFADFGGSSSGSKRLYPAPTSDTDPTDDNTPDATVRGRYKNLERETGVEPATLSLGS